MNLIASTLAREVLSLKSLLIGKVLFNLEDHAKMWLMNHVAHDSSPRMVPNLFVE